MAVDKDGEPIGACCLGIACEVARAHGVRVQIDTQLETVNGRRIRRYDQLIGTLPDAVSQWFGFVSSDPLLAAYDDPKLLYDIDGRIIRTRPASSWNDSVLATFEQISKMITHTYLDS
jgi:hypothetical protein